MFDVPEQFLLVGVESRGQNVFALGDLLGDARLHRRHCRRPGPEPGEARGGKGGADRQQRQRAHQEGDAKVANRHASASLPVGD